MYLQHLGVTPCYTLMLSICIIVGLHPLMRMRFGDIQVARAPSLAPRPVIGTFRIYTATTHLLICMVVACTSNSSWKEACVAFPTLWFTRFGIPGFMLSRHLQCRCSEHAAWDCNHSVRMCCYSCGHTSLKRKSNVNIHRDRCCLLDYCLLLRHGHGGNHEESLEKREGLNYTKKLQEDSSEV